MLPTFIQELIEGKTPCSSCGASIWQEDAENPQEDVYLCDGCALELCENPVRKSTHGYFV